MEGAAEIHCNKEIPMTSENDLQENRDSNLKVESSFGSGLFSDFESSSEGYKGSFMDRSYEMNPDGFPNNIETIENSFKVSFDNEADFNQVFTQEISNFTLDEDESEERGDEEIVIRNPLPSMKVQREPIEALYNPSKIFRYNNQAISLESNGIRKRWLCYSCLQSSGHNKKHECLLL
ncbi:unnamed protein product [Blepharisma stoltei]|uniref:Uncharacterized protein n=1 Tax=Blepharisma stoltei TaxID=1481888 RepID=A0AAU9ILE1_9CILI|nr:unnamed protein product [Blepharisma stoltei]